MIDIEFNVFSDTPNGKDPDSFSPTLRNYHQELWSKRLPNGTYFDLDLDTPHLYSQLQPLLPSRRLYSQGSPNLRNNTESPHANKLSSENIMA
jgi:hypothetical protein